MWTSIFNIAPYQHTELVTPMLDIPIPEGTKNLRLSVVISETETAQSLSGSVDVTLTAANSSTSSTVYNWSWSTTPGRGGVVSYRRESTISVPDGFAGGTVDGISTLSELCSVGFQLEYET